MANDGGPVAKLVFSEIVSDQNTRQFEVGCYLKEDLRPLDIPKYHLYGNPDGTGTDKYKSVACYKAISESLERWAFYQASGENSSKYGFDVDPSTNGMSAYPGLFKSQARSIARLEALERWALVEWWGGGLSAFTCDDIKRDQNIVIEVSDFGFVAIIWGQVDCLSENMAYGFAADHSPKLAIAKAKLELQRNIFVLKSYFEKESEINFSVLSLQEQRLIWFSKPKGHSLFLDKVTQSKRNILINKTPKLFIDCEVIGPWSAYATVWRCLFETIRNGHSLETFMF